MIEKKHHKRNNRRFSHLSSGCVITDLSFFFFFLPISLFNVLFWETKLSSSLFAFHFSKVSSSSCVMCCWYSSSSVSSTSSTFASRAPLLFPLLLFCFSSFPLPWSCCSKVASDVEASRTSWMWPDVSSGAGTDGSSLLVFLLPFEVWSSSWFRLLLRLIFSAVSLSLRLFLV